MVKYVDLNMKKQKSVIYCLILDVNNQETDPRGTKITWKALRGILGVQKISRNIPEEP